MWCNPWELKEICGNLIKIFCVCGGVYFIAWGFAKVTYKMHKSGLIK